MQEFKDLIYILTREEYILVMEHNLKVSSDTIECMMEEYKDEKSMLDKYGTHIDFGIALSKAKCMEFRSTTKIEVLKRTKINNTYFKEDSEEMKDFIYFSKSNGQGVELKVVEE